MKEKKDYQKDTLCTANKYQEILQHMGNFNVSLGFTVHPRKALEKIK